MQRPEVVHQTDQSQDRDLNKLREKSRVWLEGRYPLHRLVPRGAAPVSEISGAQPNSVKNVPEDSEKVKRKNDLVFNALMANYDDLEMLKEYGMYASEFSVCSTIPIIL